MGARKIAERKRDNKMANERSKKNSNIFRVLRLCMGLSLSDMAEKCGVSAIYLNELERGIKSNPSPQMLERIAKACGIKIGTLRFFLETKSGQALDYQQHLLQSLEEYAQSKQREEGVSVDEQEAEDSI